MRITSRGMESRSKPHIQIDKYVCRCRQTHIKVCKFGVALAPWLYDHIMVCLAKFNTCSSCKRKLDTHIRAKCVRNSQLGRKGYGWATSILVPPQHFSWCSHLAYGYNKSRSNRMLQLLSSYRYASQRYEYMGASGIIIVAYGGHLILLIVPLYW